MSNISKSDFISDTIHRIEESISKDTFIDIETGKIELKDLSTGTNWTSLKESICAFLNTDGGVVICGVRERDKKYHLTGFDRNNESKIIALKTETFKDEKGNWVDLSHYLHFDYHTISIRNERSELLILAIYPLSDDLKFVNINGKYFERQLTQDKEIPEHKLKQHREYKKELEFSKEIAPIEKAELNDLSLDKINTYINLLNKEIRLEPLKPSLDMAKPFLHNQHFTKDGKVTLLGMLVCGADPFHFLASRSEVNAYYDTRSDIGKDKKIFRNDVLTLMEETFRYIWGNIKINRTIHDGGKSEPEYPERLIRETINNALAHRDYSIDHFVTIRVEPNRFIEIRNPGSFKEKIKVTHTKTEVEIRRLIPGIPESKNPKLASILKVFDKIENQGRGMASLVNDALDNKIDLPYYEIKDEAISLFIPTGKLVDEAIENWLKGFSKYIELKIMNKLSEEHTAVLAYHYKSELLNKKRYYTILHSESNNHFNIIHELKQAGILIEHPVSTEQTPVYVLDREIMKTDFREELVQLIGIDYISFEQVAKEILNITYLFSNYSQKSLKAAEITPEVYRRLHGKEINAKMYESLGRKVRLLCNKFYKFGILKKVNNTEYLFRLDYLKSKTLFN
jgi:ATP-dependent DNA helicase RecG